MSTSATCTGHHYRLTSTDTNERGTMTVQVWTCPLCGETRRERKAIEPRACYAYTMSIYGDDVIWMIGTTTEDDAYRLMVGIVREAADDAGLTSWDDPTSQTAGYYEDDETVTYRLSIAPAVTY